MVKIRVWVIVCLLGRAPGITRGVLDLQRRGSFAWQPPVAGCYAGGVARSTGEERCRGAMTADGLAELQLSTPNARSHRLSTMPRALKNLDILRPPPLAALHISVAKMLPPTLDD
jgi:hypothetical protein